MAIPYVKQTWTDGAGGGTPVSAARLGVLEQGILDVSLAPAVHVTRSAVQAITTATATAIAWDLERYDQAGGAASTQHDTVTNNSRLTALFAGVYAVVTVGEWAASVANAAGSTVQVRQNGSTVIGRQFIGNFDFRSWHVSAHTAMAVNDYLEVIVTQNTGATVNVAQAGNYTPEFMMVRVG